MIMNRLQTLLAALLLASATTQGAMYSSGTLNTLIPDGNPAGISSAINVSGAASVLEMNVYINVSGGYNGDLYAYLSYGDTSVVLLNRIGNTSDNRFGASTSGFGTGAGWYNFLFNDSTTTTDIHAYSGTEGSPIIGTYNTDRRTDDPQDVLDTSVRGSSLTAFNSVNPNGNWTLYFADMAVGPEGSSSSLVSWGFDIAPVPEPVNVALGILGGVFLVVMFVRSRRVRDRLPGRHVATVR